MCALYSDCGRSLLEDAFNYTKEKADTFSPIQWEFRLQAADAHRAFHVEQPERWVYLLRNVSQYRSPNFTTLLHDEVISVYYFEIYLKKLKIILRWETDTILYTVIFFHYIKHGKSKHFIRGLVIAI